MARARQGQKRVLKKKGFRSCTWIKGPKQIQNQKTKTLKRLFGLASKNVFFDFHFVFFALKCKSRKNIVCFVFLKVYGWRKSPKTKKNTKQTQNQKPKL